MGNENKLFKEAIKAYLDQRAKEDSLFAVSYAKANKNLEECCAYIFGEVVKQSTSVYSNRVKACGVHNEEVFCMAVHYYDEDNIKVNKQFGNNIAVSSTMNPQKEQQVFKQPLPKEETPTYTKHKKKEKQSSSTQFLLFDEL